MREVLRDIHRLGDLLAFDLSRRESTEEKDKKTRKMFSLAILFSVLILAAMHAPHARAETVNCTPIDHLPYTITAQGVYCFTQNLGTSMTSGNAITIDTNNVVIDLNGFKLGGLGAGTGTQAFGIYADQRQNISIRNGTVRGFYLGIYLHDVYPYTTSQGHLIEDLRADLNTFTGIETKGTGNIIRNCQVVKTGGDGPWGSQDATGILAVGPGSRIINNDVRETVETTYSIGIKISGGDGAVVERNRVGNAALGTDWSIGIQVFYSSRVIVNDNSISTMTYGIQYWGSGGLYSNNRASGCTNSFDGGTAAGSTNYHD